MTYINICTYIIYIFSESMFISPNIRSLCSFVCNAFTGESMINGFITPRPRIS